MKSSDLSLTILIFIVFICLFMFNIFSLGIKNVKNDWPKYRCNPIVMPFASLFGQDAAKNFTFCIQTMQSNYMKYLLQPVHYNIGVVGDVGNVLTEALHAARAFISNLRTFIADIVKNIFGVFLNIIIEFQRITIELKDMIGKIAGIMATLMYTLDGSVITMQSTWNGAPGQTVRALQGLCFHPDTIIKTIDGKTYKMSELPLNIVLKNGAIVQSVMKISNVKQNGKYREKLYCMEGEDGNIIYVTGSHLVKSEGTFIPVNKLDEGALEALITTDELSCLITSDHTIPIGDWIFHDWEDDNGSPSKTLEK